MFLDNPISKRLVSGNPLDEAAGLSVGLIQVERPPLEKATRRLFLQIGGLFFLCFLLHSVTRGVRYEEPQANHQEAEEPCPGSPDDETPSKFLQLRQYPHPMSFLIS